MKAKIFFSILLAFTYTSFSAAENHVYLTDANLIENPEGINDPNTLKDWTWLRPLGGSTTFDDIAYGNARFVASNSLIEIIISEDGINWSGVKFVHDKMMRLTFGNGKFVFIDVVGDIYESPNGETWEFINNYSIPLNSLIDLVFLNESFYILGDGYIAKSTDLINWEQLSFPGYRFCGGTFANSLYILVGYAFSTYKPLVAYSEDSISWNFDLFDNQEIRGAFFDVTFFNDKFIAIGDRSSLKFFQSYDGMNWERDIELDNEFIEDTPSCIDSSSGILAIGGANGKALLFDGNSYSHQDVSEYGFKDIVFAEDIVVMVGYGGTIVYSTNNRDWNFAMRGAQEDDTIGVSFDGEKYISGNLFSYDGIIWSKRKHYGMYLYANGIYLKLYGNLCYSTNGTDYTCVNLPPDIQLSTGQRRLRYIGGKFFVVSYDTVLISEDGCSWDYVLASDYEQDQDLKFVDVTYGNGVYVIVSSSGNGGSLISTNAKEWILNNAPRLWTVTFGKDRFVGVFHSGIYLSEDGLTWEYYGEPERTLEQIVFADHTFYVANQMGKILSSPDGITWEREERISTSWPKQLDIANGIVFCTGNYNTIIAKRVPLFPDPNLNQAMENELGVVNLDIQKSDLNGITHLDLRGQEIQDLRGLEFIPSLEYLYLGDNPLIFTSNNSNSWTVSYLENRGTFVNWDISRVSDIINPLGTKDVDSALFVQVAFSGQDGTLLLEQTDTALSDANSFLVSMSQNKYHINSTVLPEVINLPETQTEYADDWMGLRNAVMSELFNLSSQSDEYSFFNPNNFDKILIYFPRIESYSFTGRTFENTILLNGEGALWGGLLVHEIGHYLGLPHSNGYQSLTNDPVGPGEIIEQAAKGDNMGWPNQWPLDPYSLHWNSYFKCYLGWLPKNDVIDAYGETGVYRIYQHDDIEALGPRALAIQADNATYYWIELRQSITGNPYLEVGIQIARVKISEAQILNYELLDMTPLSEDSFWDSSLLIGQTFTDITNGINVTLNGIDGIKPYRFADIEVEYYNPN